MTAVAGPRAVVGKLATGHSQFWAKRALAILALCVATLAVYYPVRHYPFFSVDDGLYVTNDPHVLSALSWENIKWAFTHFFVYLYDPVTFLSHSLDVQLFGVNPGRHHLVNLAIHILNSVLLFWILRKATRSAGPSFMVAALFALHPIQVENVAWISERKTLLSTTFFLLALGAYQWYARNPRLRRMLFVGLLYGLGLLAKPQVVTLPFILLLWDYWPLRRMFTAAPDGNDIEPSETFPAKSFYGLITEKIPLFAVAVADALITIVAEGKSSPANWPYTFAIRAGNAILCYGRYAQKAFWPSPLAAVYPHPGHNLNWSLVCAAALFLVLATTLVLVGRRHRYLVVGWLWFVGSLLPMVGLIQISYSAMSDRYAYIAFIGLFIVVCWGLTDWTNAWHFPRFVLPTAGFIVLAILSLVTYRQVGYWRDSVTLWTHTVQVTPTNVPAELQLGIAYYGEGQYHDALTHYYRAAANDPTNPEINLDIAIAEHQLRNLTLAITYYQKVLAVSKTDELADRALANMGHAYGDLGDYPHTVECYQAVQRLRASTQSSPPRGGISAWWREFRAFAGRHLP
jgi:hypothetical protein